MLVCRDMTELATDYMEGILPTRRSLAVRWHLSICSFCRRHFRQLRQTMALVRAMPTVPPSPAVEAHVMAQMASAPGGAPPADGGSGQNLI